MLINNAQNSVLERIKNDNTCCLNEMMRVANSVYREVWYNDSGLTPQAVINLLGTEAALAFNAHYKLQELIQFIDPNWVMLVPPLAYVVNNDGTVTVSV
jgi:hypothetical protein